MEGGGGMECGVCVRKGAVNNVMRFHGVEQAFHYGLLMGQSFSHVTPPCSVCAAR